MIVPPTEIENKYQKRRKLMWKENNSVLDLSLMSVWDIQVEISAASLKDKTEA